MPLERPIATGRLGVPLELGMAVRGASVALVPPLVMLGVVGKVRKALQAVVRAVGVGQVIVVPGPVA